MRAATRLLQALTTRPLVVCIGVQVPATDGPPEVPSAA
jgi:hypothetical protein